MQNQYLPGTVFIPSWLGISAITNSYPMVVSITINPVTSSNTYQKGQLVKLSIPNEYGMQQANNLTAEILDVLGSNVSLNIDSRQFDLFVVPSNPKQVPTLAPSGSRNVQYNNTTNIAFKPLNDIGN
jgi:hypothetical protein